ncbi:transmembrane protein 248-like [Limulus polyphemus]|uniref:Transmembrane protein 248-like n=1 Tax=Limulus polyphemus TaxID=6850 RepID=A0ABM1BGY6_LIMPO|nr:transmembrane protein 248-like [Limulus polyphemus]XP_022249767.1 transmembrane protein 248-like [Limulus polyphemus]
MVSHPFQSFRGLTITQPPLLVFTLCLMAFGVTMVVLAYVVGENEITDPEDIMDWNIFLKRLTELEMCVEKEAMINSSRLSALRNLQSPEYTTFDFSQTSNLTAIGNSSVLFQLSAKRPVVDQSQSLSTLITDISSSDEDIQILPNVSLSVAVPFKLSKMLWNAMISMKSLSGVVTGRLLGFSGKAADQELNVTISLPFRKMTCSEMGCTVMTCLTFYGSSMLIPQTRRPPSCQVYPTTLTVPLSLLHSGDVDFGPDTCAGGTHVTLQYEEDPELSVMLSYFDRSMVNLHLMHTSYFLFFMVMTLLCFAIIKGRYRTTKSHMVEKNLLDA